MHSLGHVIVIVTVPPHWNTLQSLFRSGRVDLELNLTGAAIGVGAVSIALEGVGATSHWAGETWAVDSLGHPIGSVVMVIRFGEYRH